MLISPPSLTTKTTFILPKSTFIISFSCGDYVYFILKSLGLFLIFLLKFRLLNHYPLSLLSTKMNCTAFPPEKTIKNNQQEKKNI